MKKEIKKPIYVVCLGFWRQHSPDGPKPTAIWMPVCRRQADYSRAGEPLRLLSFRCWWSKSIQWLGKKTSLKLMKELNEDTVLICTTLLLQLITPLRPGRTNSGHEKTWAKCYFVGISEILDFFLPWKCYPPKQVLLILQNLTQAPSLFWYFNLWILPDLGPDSFITCATWLKIIYLHDYHPH